MLKERMQQALNDQLNAEMYSSYLYLSMEAYFRSISLNGFATWMRVQTQEENFHATKFYDFIDERGGRVILQAIDAPPNTWDSPLAVFEYTYEHEQKVTGLINNLVDLALEEHDHASNIFLQWFVTEQVEEEDNASTIIERIKLVQEAKEGLFLLDQELGQRTFTAPAATAT